MVIALLILVKIVPTVLELKHVLLKEVILDAVVPELLCYQVSAMIMLHALLAMP